MSSSTTRFLMLLTAAPSPLLRRCLSPFFNNRRRLLSLSPSPLRLASPRQLHSPAAAVSSSTPSFPSPPEHHYHHPWPEWSSLLGYLSSAGHFDASGVRVSVPGLPEDATSACLSFARRRPDILGMLPRRDIEVVVEKGEPFLFDDRAESVRRMMLFLTNNVLDGNDRTETAVDLMKYLLSYVSSAAASTGRSSGHLVELSVRNLLQKMSQLGDQYYRGVHTNGQEANQLGSAQNQVLDGYLHTARPLGQNPELRRGDWICHRCRFMNFNRNVKCLQCKEAQPKRQLTGGEWECPQCDFYNYGRNTVCLRCDCKQPAVASLGTRNVGSGLVYHDDLNNMSRADNASDVSEATANEDFPEIMPLRKGVNRFVVSRRKSPLERRLVDGQRQRNQNNWGTSKSYGLQNTDGEKAVGGTISQKLDDTFGTKRFGSDNMTSRGQNAGTKYLSGDFGANDFGNVEIDKQKSNPLDAGGHTGAIYQDSALGSSPENRRPMEEPRGHNRMNMEKERAGKYDQWFDRIAELHNVADASSGISDGDFPDIMPMPEGVNRFVVSRKKDRSLTSPTYKRRMAMDPANTTNHVPFVPFPPNYFAQKDNQQPGGKTIRQSSNSASAENVNRTTASPMANVPGSKNQESSTENQNFGASGRYSNSVTTNSSYEKPISRREAQNAENCAPSASGSWRRKHSVPGYMGGRLHSTGESSQNILTPQENGLDPGSSGYSLPKYSSNTTTSAGKTSPLPEDANFTSWSTGKSLEGSQVKEPDPLDMSEEAKAERWFRRVAQIKDISELSQIPDEDFPSIMPMRKGVNRFVVSKRKTPLERRLSSNQYRRNLPTVSTDPENENNSS